MTINTNAVCFNALIENFGVPAGQVMYIGDEEKDILKGILDMMAILRFAISPPKMI